MIQTDLNLTAANLQAKIGRMWELSGAKIRHLEADWRPEDGAPVYTRAGRYVTRGWTEWTQGFQFGSAILQFDATGDRAFLAGAQKKVLQVMAGHVTHMGVHDHGFNNVSTYGNLRRLMNQGRIEENASERAFYELALKCSGAVQAARWTPIEEGGGFIYSFNGPHSLFVDTMRSLRSLALGHRLGQALMGEHDERISLLERLVRHAAATARYNVYYGQKRDGYDVPGRVAHESIFNVKDGFYRCPSSQQGYSAFSTWMRGLAWVMLGFAEQLEFIDTVGEAELENLGGKSEVTGMMLQAARASCDFYMANTPIDGVCYWDSQAPGLAKLGDYLNRPADPFNEYEPVDASAAAIAAQGLLRLGKHLEGKSDDRAGRSYFQAGLTVLNTLLDEPYLSCDEKHQGLILHSVYHRPNGWDYVPEGFKIPCGESSMWGDYHIREAALYVQRIAEEKAYVIFFA